MPTKILEVPLCIPSVNPLCYSVFQSLPDLDEFFPLEPQLVSHRVSLAKALVDRLLDSIAREFESPPRIMHRRSYGRLVVADLMDFE